ncbi:MAG: TatD family hydrolase [Candidatus Accumulibacter sp.]|jgi:TatD DNase family protein|nr:TatD family hydrolase [Accumulibacter sp.]
MLVDSHCHIDFPKLAENLPEVFESMEENGVGHLACIGVRLEDFPGILALAENDSRIFASVGLHPEVTDGREATEKELLELAAHPKVVAIGETGLDYYWHKDAPEWQRERFRTHIRAARKARKPLVIHNRNASTDVLRILAEENADEVGGVFHCFSEDREIAQRALDMGFYISFSGIVTFKNAPAVKDAAKYVPEDRFLVETDSPYLAPVPYRGKRNQPAYVRYVAEEIARLRETSFERIATASTENFFRLFKHANRRTVR